MAALRRFLSIAAISAACTLASCVYPFDPGLESVDSRIVVEGSISVGGTSEFKFTRVIPMGGDAKKAEKIEMTGYIEGEDGVQIPSYQGWWDNGSGILSDGLYQYDSYGGSTSPASYHLYFDTAQVNPSQRYRVHFEDRENGAVYESDWLDVCEAPVIDELSYILNRDRFELNVALSMHSESDSHFRWYYDETWEYHADLDASHYLVPEYLFNSSTGEYQPERAIFQFSGGQNNYYCWDTFHSPVIKIFSTSEQTDNRFIDLEFHRVSSANRKLQMMYKLTVYLEAISENAFQYWKNIEDNTGGQGTFFSPVPSQMRGNIHCVTDPEAEVIGYVSAARQATASMYYDDRTEKFYNGSGTDWSSIVIEEFTDINAFASWYSRGYLPYTVIPANMSETGQTTYQWAKAECVDCRRLGGTKEKPAGWPTNDR